MEKAEMVLTPSVASELLSPVIEAVLSLPQERVDYWHGRSDELRDEIIRVIGNGHQNLMAELKEWERFYEKFFGIKTNFERLVVPPKREGFDRLLVIAQGLTPTSIFNRMLEKKIRVFRRFNFSEARSTRNADTHYALWVRDLVEPDENLAEIPAKNLRTMAIPAITLEEAMVHECKFHHDTGNHLNVRNVTICAGSWLPKDVVPGVALDHGDIVMISPFDSTDGLPHLRAREVVV